MLVITAVPRSSALVASSRPPSPTSHTSRSIRGAIYASASTVSISNSVAWPSSAAMSSRVGRKSSKVATKSSSLIGFLLIWIRSVYETRCGFGMNPTRWPAASRMAARQTPVDPLPFVPAISAPLSPRSGAPRWSRIARVRSVPSFIPKRPSRDMWPIVSRYVKSRLPLPLGASPSLGLEGVLDQHRPGHRPHTAGIWCQPTGHLVHACAEVADLLSADPVGAHVDHRGSRFDHLPGDEVDPARGRDQYVRGARVARQVARSRVTQGHSRVSPQQEQSGGLADEVAAADNHRVAA